MVRSKMRQVRKLNNLISTNVITTVTKPSITTIGKDKVTMQTIQIGQITRPINCKLIISNKWVINLSKTNLTEGQESVLAKGPNFSITPKYIHNVDYIRAVESMCQNLKEEDAVELRLDINTCY